MWHDLRTAVEFPVCVCYHASNMAAQERRATGEDESLPEENLDPRHFYAAYVSDVSLPYDIYLSIE